MGRPRMMVIGLDCAAPRLVFDRYRDAMPNLSALMENGTWGSLRSSEPPITVPAWTCML
ncbi:MAG: alkaline phosphatase family protein, partial [Deltaproteobacteria bacterium]